MKKIIGLVAVALTASAFASAVTPKPQWLTVDNSVLAKIRPKLNKSVQTLFSGEGASVVQLSATEVEQLSHLIHNELHRCGGFMQHDSLEEATNALTVQGDMHFAQKAIFSDYDINQQSILKPM